MDALLGGLDRLIAKKRDLKQAAMQQLLTGQTRLPGFHGEWEVKRLDRRIGTVERSSDCALHERRLAKYRLRHVTVTSTTCRIVTSRFDPDAST